jgi:multiple sugar transport system permease protein
VTDTLERQTVTTGRTGRAADRSAARVTRRRRRSLSGNDNLVGYLFVAPQVLGIVLFVLLPLVLILYYSFHEWNVLANTFRFVGTENVERLFSDPKVAPVLGATGIFSVGLVIGNLFRTLFFSPVVVSLVAWTIVWGFLLQDDGGINGLLQLIGVDGPNWLREGPTAMLSVIVVQVFKNVGLNMILFLSSLQGVPKEITEAAAIDGAGPFRTFGRITLPLISPMILLTTIITIVGSLQVFAQIAVLTQGGPGISTTVLVYYLFQQAFEFHRFGYGSALALVLFVIVLVLTVVQWQLRKRWVHYES